jgi:hypothetical protein
MERATEKGDCFAVAPPAGREFVVCLASVLNHLVTQAGNAKLTRFDAVRPPSISIEEYLSRLSTYFGCSAECFVLALIYVDRLVQLHESFTVNKTNVHRLILAAVLLAAKYFDDSFYSNSFYSKVGGVRTKELNTLEACLLEMLQWRLYVSPEEYAQYMSSVTAAVRPARQAALEVDVDAESSRTEDDCGGSDSCSSSASTCSPVLCSPTATSGSILAKISPSDSPVVSDASTATAF